MRIVSHRAGLLFLVAGVWLTACGGGGEKPVSVIEQHQQAGEVTLRLRFSPAKLTVADTARLSLEVDAPEGTKVEFPAAGEKLGGFTVAATEQSSPELTGKGRVKLERGYDLEPFLSGEYTVPALTVKAGAAELKTEPVKVEVVSVLKNKSGESKVKDIAPPVSLPGLPVWIYAGLGALLVAVALFFWWRRRRPKPVERLPAAHEIALRELRELMAEDLIARGEAKLFYLRVSAILRHYIEARFGLHAPESTTEEFLKDLRGHPQFSESQRELLRRFLQHCDMVKFAEYQPDREEIDDTVNTCAQFIAETREREPAPVGGGG